MICREALAIIMESESLSLTAYQDVAGVWTIGYGHTAGVGPTTPPVTEEEAWRLLEEDLSEFEAHVRAAVKVPITPWQLGALVSLCYNIGPGNLSRWSGLPLLNAGNYAGCADRFWVWRKAGGAVQPGLVRRRGREEQLFKMSLY